MKKLFIIMLLILLPGLCMAKGGGGGGARGGSFGGGARSSVSAPKSTAPKTTTSSPKTSAPKASAPKPTNSIKSATKSTAPKPASVKGKSTGYVVGQNYTPKFRGGYAPPAGSVVYYQDNSFLEYMMFWQIMNSNNAHKEATVVTPDGKEQKVKEEGVDSMYIFNWIIFILLAAGLIGLAIYLVNRYTNKEVR